MVYLCLQEHQLLIMQISCLGLECQTIACFWCALMVCSCKGIRSLNMISAHARERVCMCACVRVCGRVLVSASVCTHIHMRTYMRTYIQTDIQTGKKYRSTFKTHQNIDTCVDTYIPRLELEYRSLEYFSCVQRMRCLPDPAERPKANRDKKRRQRDTRQQCSSTCKRCH